VGRPFCMFRSRSAWDEAFLPAALQPALLNTRDMPASTTHLLLRFHRHQNTWLDANRTTADFLITTDRSLLRGGHSRHAVHHLAVLLSVPRSSCFSNWIIRTDPSTRYTTCRAAVLILPGSWLLDICIKHWQQQKARLRQNLSHPQIIPKRPAD